MLLGQVIREADFFELAFVPPAVAGSRRSTSAVASGWLEENRFSVSCPNIMFPFVLNLHFPGHFFLFGFGGFAGALFLAIIDAGNIMFHAIVLFGLLTIVPAL